MLEKIVGLDPTTEPKLSMPVAWLLGHGPGGGNPGAEQFRPPRASVAGLMGLFGAVRKP